MKKAIWICFFGFFGLLLVVFAILIVYVFFAPDNYVKEGIYYSRSGRFEVPVPVHNSPGGNIEDGKSFVSFTDDFCSLYRIDSYILTKSQKKMLKDRGREDYLEYFLDKIYFNTFLQKVEIPKPTIDFKEYLGEADNGSLYAQIDTPKSSVCTVSVNDSPPVREDAKRGTVATIFGRRIYVISTNISQVNLSLFENTSEWDDEKREKLKNNTMSFAQTITFKR